MHRIDLHTEPGDWRLYRLGVSGVVPNLRFGGCGIPKGCDIPPVLSANPPAVCTMLQKELTHSRNCSTVDTYEGLVDNGAP